MAVLVHLCTCDRCSDMAEHLKFAANAPEVIVVFIAIHNEALSCKTLCACLQQMQYVHVVPRLSRKFEHR